MSNSFVLESVEHDSQNEIYRYPMGAAEAQSMVRMRIKVQAQSKNISVKIHTWNRIDGERLVVMNKDDSITDANYYVTYIEMPEKGCLEWYYFIIELGDKKFFYGNAHDRMGGIGHVSDGVEPAAYQITVYNEGAKTPDWFKHSVMYQIFPDRFYRVGDKMVKKKGAVYHASWDDPPFYYKDPDTREIVNYDFYGGNLQGIIAKLPYIKKMGICVIYLNPIFEAASNHRYDTGDYNKVDPILGSEKDLRELCEKAKKMGIRIMLDGVFSHTGDDSVYFNRYGRYDSVGAYQSKESPYFSWYNFREYPNKYESWWGFHTLPNITEETPSYMDFIINNKDSVLHHWMECGISGWRLDVLDELPPGFSQAFYAELKKTDPDAVMLGEVWEDASNKNAYGVQREYLCGQETDSVMNYVFRQIVLDFLLGGADGKSAERRVRSMQENYPAQNLYAMMNLLGSHDRERILTILGQAPSCENVPAVHQAVYRLDRERLARGIAREKLASLWQMTFPGVPSVYYGDEIAMEGYRDPYCRCPYDWDGGNADLREWYEKIIAIRNENVVLQTGRLEHVYGEGDVYGFARVIDNGKDLFGAKAENGTFIVLLNRADHQRDVYVDVSKYKADCLIDEFTGNKIPVVYGKIQVSLPGFGYVLLRPASRPVNYPRQAGVLMHITSLPSKYGIGDLGEEAYKFVDVLARGGQKIWQLLPLNPITLGNYSPYSSNSAFAGNIYLISLEQLVNDGYLLDSELEGLEIESASRANYEYAISVKDRLLKSACKRFFKRASEADKAEYELFCNENADWLDDYVDFVVLKKWYKGKSWTEWGKGFRKRDSKALAAIEALLWEEIRQEKFNQFIFARQLKRLKDYANKKSIQIMGDMPMFVSHDSSDTWANQKLFALDHEGRPVYVAGVPPDYFSATGQLWGNPQYDWDAMEADDYQWWIKRIKHVLEQVNLLRIDHFRAFDEYWEVPAGEPTAVNGKWQPGPGMKLFNMLKKEISEDTVIVAEDLGSYSETVVKLVKDTGFPEMKVLHFEMSPDDKGNLRFIAPENSLVYTGTHDNNTTVGWLKEEANDTQIKAIRKLLNMPGGNSTSMCSGLIAYAYSSPARMAIIPTQDLLGLDSKYRMNVPGTVDNNWNWRLTPEQLRILAIEKAPKLKKLCTEYKR